MQLLVDPGPLFPTRIVTITELTFLLWHVTNLEVTKIIRNLTFWTTQSFANFLLAADFLNVIPKNIFYEIESFADDV